MCNNRNVIKLVVFIFESHLGYSNTRIDTTSWYVEERVKGRIEVGGGG